VGGDGTSDVVVECGSRTRCEDREGSTKEADRRLTTILGFHEELILLDEEDIVLESLLSPWTEE
jgi:hypothetical protein